MSILDEAIDNYRDEGELRVDTRRQGLTVIIGVILALIGFLLPVANTNDKLIVAALILVGAFFVIAGLVSLIENLLEINAKTILYRQPFTDQVETNQNQNFALVRALTAPMAKVVDHTVVHAFADEAMTTLNTNQELRTVKRRLKEIEKISTAMQIAINAMELSEDNEPSTKAQLKAFEELKEVARQAEEFSESIVLETPRLNKKLGAG